MMATSYPTKLKDAPILEVVTEIRFKGNLPAIGDLLPGLLYPKLKNEFPAVSRLPFLDIQSQFQEFDQNLKYRPKQVLTGKEYQIFLGDHIAFLSQARPYGGWEKYKPIAMQLYDAIRQTELITEVERIAIKYVNLLEAKDLKSQHEMVNFAAMVGGRDLQNEIINLKTEFIDDGCTNIIELVTNAEIKTKDNKIFKGMLLTVDSIILNPSNFWDQAEKYLERVHATEKKIFFNLLRKEAVEKYNPVWEKK